jgi:hypothetical protein
MFTKKDKQDLLDEIANLHGEVRTLRAEKSAVEQATTLLEEVDGLKRKIADLKIDESRLTEKHERERREVEHMVGLERKRQEFEIDQARREAEVEVKTTALAADRKRFEEQMEFMVKRLESEVTYLKDDILKAVLDRLPTVTVDRTIDERRRTKEETA